MNKDNEKLTLRDFGFFVALGLALELCLAGFSLAAGGIIYAFTGSHWVEWSLGVLMLMHTVVGVPVALGAMMLGRRLGVNRWFARRWLKP